MPRRKPHKQAPYAPSLGSQMSVCHSKRRYLNKLEAERAAELKNLEDSTLTIDVYQCDVCKKWHLTRQSRDLRGANL